MGFGKVIMNVFMQSGHRNKSECIETESGTGHKPAPRQFPVFTTQSLKHYQQFFTTRYGAEPFCGLRAVRLKPEC
jgi:hypothetical protein